MVALIVVFSVLAYLVLGYVTACVVGALTVEKDGRVLDIGVGVSFFFWPIALACLLFTFLLVKPTRWLCHHLKPRQLISDAFLGGIRKLNPRVEKFY